MADPSLSPAQVFSDHAMHRATIEAWLLAHPLLEIEAADLKLITPHYQQRISEIRQSGHLTGRIVNVKRTRLVDGKVKAADGAYRWEPHESLGRDASQPASDHWTAPGAPFGPEPFHLTPPEP